MSLEATLKKIEQEDEFRAARLEIARLRQVISCAQCAACGDEIADQNWVVTTGDQLVHEACDAEG